MAELIRFQPGNGALRHEYGRFWRCALRFGSPRLDSRITAAGLKVIICSFTAQVSVGWVEDQETRIVRRATTPVRNIRADGRRRPFTS